MVAGRNDRVRGTGLVIGAPLGVVLGVPDVLAGWAVALAMEFFEVRKRRG